VVEAVRTEAGVPAMVKWPNDVLVGDCKLAGLLAERGAGWVVLGIGVNVSAVRAELPEAATSLALEGAQTVDRARVLRAVLARLAGRLAAWDAGGPCDGRPEELLRMDYLAACATVGRAVRVELPGGRVVLGTAVDVDASGQLVVASQGRTVCLAAGDVVHVR
jgi:BirA family transcriptional regulator, biotin operon repressor / biotin---[acetyl-CoA-carboxylase] ligase